MSLENSKGRGTVLTAGDHLRAQVAAREPQLGRSLQAAQQLHRHGATEALRRRDVWRAPLGRSGRKTAGVEVSGGRELCGGGPGLRPHRAPLLRRRGMDSHLSSKSSDHGAHMKYLEIQWPSMASY